MQYTFALAACLLAGTACTKRRDSVVQDEGPRSFASAPIQTWQDIGDITTEPTAIRRDLQSIFCLHVYKLPLKADFSEELKVLCDNKKPSSTFDQIDRYAGRIGESPRSIQLELEHDADGFTRGTSVTVYRVPIAPKWVRSASIPSYMVATSVFPYVQLEGSVTDDLTSTLGGDLQFGKWHLAYHSNVQTPAQTAFSNDRKTALNSYQVEGGNPDIGIGAEHLLDADNPDFKYYNTTTITIGNEDGGSTLITIIRLAVRHNGFPELAAQTFSDIATSQATHVRDGLMAEKAAGRFPD
ncbi:MAG TPA: hypothetical protein VE954_09205 [Oligoflexus sp.]|uniref:hypothetical protein n=1 Tax=Oligoflexus sp. TaxID=1971216 RepID=UPI002D281569|nr:hypothetical protein [Oligoflexus sp.]HYX33278.1 hypothetical protein [Oligoflexus sp.]